MKHGIDDEAMRILDEAGWLFDPRFDGFMRTARGHESTADYQARRRLVPCSDVILWEELRDHFALVTRANRKGGTATLMGEFGRR